MPVRGRGAEPARASTSAACGAARNALRPALGEVVLARAGYPGFFAAATAFALLSLALIARVARDGREKDVRTSPLALSAGIWREMLRTLVHTGLRRVLVATMLFGTGVGTAFYFVAPFTRDVAIARAAPFFTAYATTTIALRIFGRRLPDRLGPQRVAPPSFAVFSLGLAALTLLPRRGVLVLAGMACGAGHGLLFPVLTALALTRTPAHLQGMVVSLYTAALDLGQTIGTPLGGAIAHVAGYRVMFAAMPATSLAGLVLMATERPRVGA